MQDKTKEIEAQLDKSRDPLQKLMLENRLAWEYSLSHPAKAIALAMKNKEQALFLNNNNEVGFALMAMANAYLRTSDYDNVFKCAYEADEILKVVGNKRGKARALNILSNAYFELGNYEESLNCRFKSLNLYEEIGNEEGKVSNLLNLGNVNAAMKNFHEAVKYYSSAIEFVQKTMDESQLKALYMNLGSVFGMQGNYDKALEYYSLSSKFVDELPDHSDVNLYNNLAEVYFMKADIERSKQYYDLALILSKKTTYKLGEANSLLGLSRIEAKKNSLEKAVILSNDALTIFREVKINQGITECLLLLSELFEKLGDFAAGLSTFREYNKIKEEMWNIESEKKTRNLLLLHQVDELKKDADAQQVVNVELKKANHEIEVVNKDLLASISYAKHVQDAILPNENRLKQYFSDSFLFSKPKDIVSGDFFWIYEKEEEILIASVDCTGHGVPGAFMSVVANSLLNQISMNQWPANPSFMLNELNFLVERGLTSKEDDVARDGMDIALCSFTKLRSKMVFSGAHSTILVISGGSLKEYKGDRTSIGHSTTAYFNNINVPINKEDCIYMFTDGYIDQRGGLERKKFYYEPFKRTLLQIHKQPMAEQKKIIEQTIAEWMGNEKQLDDMQVIGIRI